uniref:AB hydrolase-1 domain-containing protein n=1 Tax=Mola mola TaxID=94237 RepID=A0A3Q3W8W8_MOLML
SLPVKNSLTNPTTSSELSIPVPWGEIRGKIWGPDHGHPVLCVHGWADNCGSFNTLIPLLPKECRYVAVDLPGHGLSCHRGPGVLYMFPSYVLDVCRVVDALQWNKFSIIGHSMGECGFTAGFSALYPEMVDALILLDIYGFLPTDLVTLYVPNLMRQGLDEMLQFDKQPEEKRVYTYENALKRLLAANPTISEQSGHILLERGLAKVEGGMGLFLCSVLCFQKNIVRMSLEQSLEMQSRIKAAILLVLYGLPQMSLLHVKFILLHVLYVSFFQHMVVNVPGDHHVHLNNPEVVAPIISEFLRTKVLSQSDNRTDEPKSKL